MSTTSKNVRVTPPWPHFGSLSEAEKVYVVHGVSEDVRVDGRTRRDVRPATSLETDIVTHASGPVPSSNYILVAFYYQESEQKSVFSEQGHNNKNTMMPDSVHVFLRSSRSNA